jgi:hypothetical protein
MLEPRQSTRHLLLVRPAAFAGNLQTQASNAFQHREPPPPGLAAAARAELAGVVEALLSAGAEPLVVDDLPGGASPDAVFPNNWVSFHQDGTVVLYPMLAANRRRERRRDVVEQLAADHGFIVDRIIDLSPLERDGQFLEGTGSLVLDRPAGVAYAALSPRTVPAALQRFASETGYRVLSFTARDTDGQPYYHTNVMMGIGSGYALACLDAVDDPRQRAGIAAALDAGGHELVPLSPRQVQAFAGNCLEIQGDRGPVLLLSATAAAALLPAQRAALERYAALLPVAVPLIERHGGGSVRCMIAEIHLPRAIPRNQHP